MAGSPHGRAKDRSVRWRTLAAAAVAAGLTTATPRLGEAAEPSRISAEQRAQFATLVDRALVLYERREYGAAIRTFEKAYLIEPKPELVYNIARSYEKALQPDQAIAEYERFVELEGTTAELRAKALESLVALRREQAARLQARAAETAVAGSPEPRGSEPAEVAAWGLLGGGTTLVAAGAVFGILTLDAQAELDRARDAGASPLRIEGLAQTTDDRALATDVLLGTGIGAAAAGAIILWLLDDRGVEVGPTAGPDAAGAQVRIRF